MLLAELFEEADGSSKAPPGPKGSVGRGAETLCSLIFREKNPLEEDSRPPDMTGGRSESGLQQ